MLDADQIPSASEVNQVHTHSDLDGGSQAQHHSLGYGPGQAAPGTDVSRRLAIIEALMKSHGWI